MFRRKRIERESRLFKPIFSNHPNKLLDTDTRVYEAVLWANAELLLAADRFIAFWNASSILNWITFLWMTLVLLILLLNTFISRKFASIRCTCMVWTLIGYFILFPAR